MAHSGNKWNRFWWLVVPLWLHGSTASGLAGAKFWRVPFPEHTKHVTIHSLADLGDFVSELGEDAMSSRALRLFRHGGLDADGALRLFIGERVLQTALGVVEVRRPASALRAASNFSGWQFNFMVGALEVCDSTLTLYRSDADGSIFITGNLPDARLDFEIADAEAPLDDEDLGNVLSDKMGEMDEMGEEPVSGSDVISKRRCLGIEDGAFIVQDLVTFRASGLTHQATIRSGEVVAVQPLHFGVKAVLTAYKKNPKDGAIGEEQLDLIGDGTLTSEFIAVRVPSTFQAAVAVDNRFIYGADDAQFAETNIMVHATRHLAWLGQKGYAHSSPAPLGIFLHQLVRGSRNNAIYEPIPTPRILIADGDGNVLSGLPFDQDVVSHEFGHHVIWPHLKKVDGEALVIHEGMADLLTFSRTGDSCLGDSICPASATGGACFVPRECLRSAETTLRFRDALYSSLSAHQQGQVLSGVVWDMRRNSQMPAESTISLALRSLDFLNDNSGLRDWVLALLLADRDLFQRRFACPILTAVSARGLGVLVPELHCENVGAFEDNLVTPAAPPQKKSKKSKIVPSCGRIAADRGETSGDKKSILGFLLLAALPAGAALRRNVLGYILLPISVTPRLRGRSRAKT